MTEEQSNNPVENYVTTNRFYVEIGENIVASFSECSGVSVDIDKQVYLEGGVNDQQRISLGQTRFSDITLKRGTTNDNTFSEWMSELFDDEQITQRRNVNILTYNQAGDVVKSWKLIGAIPVGWKLPSLEANGNAVAVEELTLAFEGLKISSEAGGSSTVTRDESGFFATSSWGDNQSGDQQASLSFNGGKPSAGGRPSANGGKPSAGGRPSANGGKPSAGGRPSANGGKPSAGGRPSANGGKPSAGGRPSANGGKPSAGGRPNANGGKPSGGRR